MCIRDRAGSVEGLGFLEGLHGLSVAEAEGDLGHVDAAVGPVSYTHLRAHETVLDLVCRLLLEKKKTRTTNAIHDSTIDTNKNIHVITVNI